MPTKINDDELLRYLEDHTYDETMEHFGISRMTIARIRKRNKIKFSPNKIKLAIVGIGNAASALIQGIEYYKARGNNIGLLHPILAGYHISDIEIVAAYDISEKKVGKDLSEAVFENELAHYIDLPKMNVVVEMGELLDGVIDQTRKIIKPASLNSVDIVNSLKKSEAEILLCLLPSGADKAVNFYVQKALDAGCAFINGTPSSIATNKTLARKFYNKGLPLIGDDLQDQFGATIVHKLILQQMIRQGIDIKESYALDVGGGAESLNTIHRSREIKREIKSETVSSSLNINTPIVAGTSDYVPHLKNGRNSMLWIVGRGFLGNEVILDIKIQSQDGPNGGSVLADVIRATKIALLQGEAGAINEISCYGFKHPPHGTETPEIALKMLADFVLGRKQ
ncbi:MAG: inositol-3-phosphate synthase [Candidatus Lokiarchaeota archaeon]|nr:inositol-3-phosphate synthase [Candidatus Harpocratesius repetitus]